jgi:hemoglobin
MHIIILICVKARIANTDRMNLNRDIRFLGAYGMDGAAHLDGEQHGPCKPTEQTPYEMIGGEAGVRKLVERFYDIMDSNPDAAGVRAMHAADLAPMRDTLFEYLSGAFGGPPLYMRRPNAKCIMSAHAHFAIGASEVEQWMLCMRGALDVMDMPATTKRLFEDGFLRMADAMHNR